MSDVVAVWVGYIVGTGLILAGMHLRWWIQDRRRARYVREQLKAIRSQRRQSYDEAVHWFESRYGDDS